MIKRILTICAAVLAAWRLARRRTSLALGAELSGAARRGLFAVPAAGSAGYPADYRRGPGPPDFDGLEDDDGPNAQSSTALPPPGPVLSPDDPRYGRPMGAPPVYSDRGPVLSPDDPRYGRPMGAPPVYSDRGPVLSPDDPRYGRPDGPPPVIYSDRPGSSQPQTYSDRGADRGPGAGYIYPDEDNRGPRPPGAITGAVQPPQGQPPLGADGRPMVLSALPPDEQPEAAPAQLAPNLRRQEVAFATKEPAGTLIVDTPEHLSLLRAGWRARDPLRRPRRPRRLHLDRRAEESRARPSGRIGIRRRR